MYEKEFIPFTLPSSMAGKCWKQFAFEIFLIF